LRRRGLRNIQFLSKLYKGKCLTSIHSWIEELDSRHLHRFPFALRQAIALIVSFGRIDRIYLGSMSVKNACEIQHRELYTSPRNKTTKSACHSHRQGRSRRSSTMESCQQLFAAFIGHEIYSCSNSITHCIVTYQP